VTRYDRPVVVAGEYLSNEYNFGGTPEFRLLLNDAFFDDGWLQDDTSAREQAHDYFNGRKVQRAACGTDSERFNEASKLALFREFWEKEQGLLADGLAFTVLTLTRGLSWDSPMPDGIPARVGAQPGDTVSVALTRTVDVCDEALHAVRYSSEKLKSYTALKRCVACECTLNTEAWRQQEAGDVL
jgi:hypothetical protein